MASTTKIIVVDIIVIIIAAAGYWYYTTTQPRKTEITLMTKAGMWADFIKTSGGLEDYKKRMLKERNIEINALTLSSLSHI